MDKNVEKTAEAACDEVIVSLRHVSKCYEIYDKPRHRLQQMLFGRWKTYYNRFFALKDINFEVRRGECVGIIGRNGSGKSTILQIIAGVLHATEGEVYLKPGIRIAALLELGSGFNPEFTGRENVYMNAGILGFSKEETTARFSEIEAFADIGEFIDRPVKTYSSGMMVRLAFSVQVMLNPDLLIVDEALAVGDAMFQQKCYRRIRALQEKGVTILFVSHSLVTVQSICSKAICLVRGCVDSIGDTAEITERYFRLSKLDESEMDYESRKLMMASKLTSAPVVSNGLYPFRVESDFGKSDRNRQANPKVEYTAFDIYNARGERVDACNVFDDLTFVMHIRVNEDYPAGLRTGVNLKNDNGLTIFNLNQELGGSTMPELKKGETYVVTYRFKAALVPRKYVLSINIREVHGDDYCFVDDIFHVGTLEILPRNVDDNRQLRGILAFEHADVTVNRGEK